MKWYKDKQKHQTNFQRITKSEEALAEFISSVLDYGFGVDYEPKNPMGNNVIDKKDIVAWLKQESTE